MGDIGIEPNADADDDGMSNRQEYTAGADPNDSGSIFEFISIRLLTPSVIELKWLSASNRSYIVFRNIIPGTNGPDYVSVATTVPSTFPTNTLLVTNNPSRGPYFYRLQTQVE